MTPLQVRAHEMIEPLAEAAVEAGVPLDALLAEIEDIATEVYADHQY